MSEEVQDEIENDLTEPLWIAYQAGFQLGTQNPFAVVDPENEELIEQLTEQFYAFLEEHDEELESYYKRRGATFKLQKSIEMWLDSKDYMDNEDS